MDKQLELQKRALRIWIYHAPERTQLNTLLTGGEGVSAADGEALFVEIEKIKQQLERQLSSLTSSVQTKPKR